MIIDSHTHLFDVFTGHKIKKGIVNYPLGITMLLEWLGYKKGNNNKTPNKIIRYLALYDNLKRSQCGTIENLVFYMSENKIQKSLVWAIEPFVKTKELIEIYKDNNNLLPIASINLFNNPDLDIVNEFKKNISDKVFGLKIHPIIQNIHPASEIFLNVLEEYAIYKKPVFLHTGSSSVVFREYNNYEYGSIYNFEKAVKTFPDILFIFGHMGNNTPLEAIDLAKKYSNIILETSYQNNKIIKIAINNIGIERIIFGSDFPYSRQYYALKEIFKLKISCDNLEKILFKNIKKIINI